MGGQRFLLVLSLILIAIAIRVSWPYRGPIVFAVILGYLLHPVYRWFVGRVKYRPVASGLVLTLVAVALVVPFVIVGYALVDDVQQIAESVQGEDPTDQATRRLSELGIPAAQVERLVQQAAEQATSFLQSSAVTAVVSVTEFVIALVVFFILLYFVLVDGEDLIAYLRRTIPLDATRRDRLLARTGERVEAILLGTLLVSVVQGVAAGLGWWILGFPAPVFWGFVMMILAVIPFFGPFIVLLPAGGWALLQGDTFAGVALIVWALVLVGLVDDVLRPYVIGRRSHVHPAVILVGILGGVVAFGVTGFILGPLFLSLLGPVFEAWSRPDEEQLEDPEADDGDEGGGNDEDGPRETDAETPPWT